MADSDEQLQVNTYIWSQSNDQVTISFLVPESARPRDLDIKIESQYVKAGLKDREPVFKAKLFAPINHFDSMWQLEKNSASPFSSLTASPSLSIASSYAFMSPSHSPNSSMILPAPVLDSGSLDASSSAQMADLLLQTAALGTNQYSESTTPPSSSDVPDEMLSSPSSPVMVMSPTSSVAVTPPQLPSGSSSHHQHSHHQPSTKYRILTIHLEKVEDGLEWAIPVASGWKSEMELDMTSAYHLASWHESRMGNFQRALDYYLHAAERGHTASMIKVAALYEADEEIAPNATKYVEKDSKKAFEWYKRAADLPMPAMQGSGPDALACYVVGTLYGSGSPEAGVEKNYEQALHYYNRCMLITAPYIDFNFGLLDQEHIPKSQLRNHAPQTRNERYFSSSAFQTGLVYLYGSKAEGETVASVTDVDVNAPLAIRYWREAAVLGHAQSCFNIGIVLANGLGVDQDLWNAGKWFGRAIKLDNTQRLTPPEGVPVISDWDASRSDQIDTLTSNSPLSEADRTNNKKKQRRKKRRSKKQNKDDDLLVWAMILGSVTAVAGVAWYWYHRTSATKSST
ncbi:HCP-like protein [Hesseltinella vesiculosa]|uniref:HCP-like protein n=1 Tax=Hesseltinella vesiculosa TaxID=101127 RepID=A0A1X2G5M4_9FUNG|nr:HCP-like protein [Hesseltinella vesiculosa]